MQSTMEDHLDLTCAVALISKPDHSDGIIAMEGDAANLVTLLREAQV